ncbi:MAG: four helix bundle protein [Candidatus Omnitrophica bacterium]|nr:four helix bundle protein [Candidatus Omnitrophota bacterium]
MEKVKTYRDLNIWVKSVEFVKEVYIITVKFPKEEIYGLSSQMRRSVVSIPSNIAEGFRRQYNKEFRQFLYIALGSCAELETQVSISKELNYIKGEKEKELLEILDHISRMIMNLIKKL